MAKSSDRQHLIWRIHRETSKRGQPVTFREIYSRSARPREALAAELQALVNEGLVAVTRPPEGAVGRPTDYYHLVNDWERPEVAPVGSPHDILVPTDRPSPNADPDFTMPKKSGRDMLPEIDSESTPDQIFLTLGPLMWEACRDGKVSDPKSQVWGKFASKYGLTDAQAVEVWNRLASPVYDEYFTEWGIVTSKATREDGTRDRRVGGGTGQYYVPRGSAAEISDVPKSVQQRRTQERHAKHMLDVPQYSNLSVEEMIDILRDTNHYPVPSDDVPDMSHFAAILKGL